MGMLAFTDTAHQTQSVPKEEPVAPKYKSRPQSILGECLILFALK